LDFSPEGVFSPANAGKIHEFKSLGCRRSTITSLTTVFFEVPFLPGQTDTGGQSRIPSLI
jgi:hypothetical protein